MDDAGARGPANSIRLITPEQLPTLRLTNYFLIVGQVFDFFSQTAYDDRVKKAGWQDVDSTAIRTYSLNYTNTGYAYYSEIDCINGGLATDRGSPVSCDGRCRMTTRLYYACGVDNTVLSGRIDTNSGYSSMSYTFNELSILQDNQRTLFMSGRLAGRQLGSIIDSAYERSALIERYESPDFQGATVVTDVNTVFSYGTVGVTEPTGSARLAGSLTLRSPVTGNKTVAVTTPLEFSNGSSGDQRFVQGEMQLLADDGSRLILNADNGNPDTLEVTLTLDGSSSTFSEPWTTWIDHLPFW